MSFDLIISLIKSDISCFTVESLAMQRYRAVQQLFQLFFFLGGRGRRKGKEDESYY